MPQILVLLITTGAINYIYGYFAIGVTLVVFYQRLRRNRIMLNAAYQVDFWVLFFFGISYAVIGYDGSIQSLFYYVMIPIVSYLAGWVIIETALQKKETEIHSIIIAAMLGCCVHAGLNYISNIGKERWLLTDFFTGELRAATGSGSMNTIAFALLFYFLFVEKSRIIKAVGIGCFTVSILYALLLGTRTQFIIMVACVLCGVGLYLFTHKGKKDKIILLMWIAIIGFMAYIAFRFDLGGVRDYIMQSNLNTRFVNATATAETDTQRIESITEGLISLLDNPMGGLNSRTYFHNMWLDVGRVGGVIPAVLMLLFTMSNLLAVRRFFLSNAQEEVRYMIALLTCGFILNFFVEPVLEGLFDSFYFYVILHGMLKCCNNYRVLNTYI